ncbi:MAG TPA: hypothetical protein VIA45_01925 [Thermoanaerobaculia bacterium]|jgi:hypothetical protein
MNDRSDTRIPQSTARRLVLLLPIALLLSILPARAEDEEKSKCQAFYGPFTSVVVPPPDCKSPVGLCTHGTLVGELPATYDFTALTQTADPNDPNVVTLTGKSVVTTAAGVIRTDDVSVINFASGDFVTKALVHKTKIREAKTGGFIAAGNLDLATGQATGNYSAILCSRRDD